MAIAGSKTELENQIRNLKQAYYIGFAAYELLGSDEAIRLLNKPPHNQIVANWSQFPERKEVERREFLKLLIRAMVKETFETIKAYCADTKQLELFMSQDWYNFARLIRNAVSHNFRFDFSKEDKANRLPLTWRGKTLLSDMDDQELTTSFIGFDDAWQLVIDMQSFVAESALR